MKKTKIKLHVADVDCIESVEGFIGSFFKLRKAVKNEKLLLRGLSDFRYELLPTVGREHEYADKAKKFDPDDERMLLHRFRRRAYPLQESVLRPWEGLFLARHYGLPTRLMDWTANALSGLYFACRGNDSVDGALWAFTRLRGHEGLDVLQQTKVDFFAMFKRDKKRADPGHITKDAVRIVDPIFNSPRLVAQDGSFTFHSNPLRPLDSYADVLFEEDNLDIDRLYRWQIQGRYKPRIIAQLSGMGITHRIVFPDLDGIARSVWETEVLWRGTPKSKPGKTSP